MFNLFIEYLLYIFNTFFNKKIFSLADVSNEWQLGFQDPATPVMEGIINFHHDLMSIILLIVFFVFWILFRIIYFFKENSNKNPAKFVHGTTIEIIWTIIPALILATVAAPSFALMYASDEMVDPEYTLKITGHQWFWNYEYNNLYINDSKNFENQSFSFDSYMVPEDELENGQLRLLEVDNRIVLPIKKHVRLLVTASDVLHSWAVPSLGVKIDACPGRLNQGSMYILREGVFYGQCSEICGINHGFMPIVIEAVENKNFISWFSSQELDKDF